MGLQVENLSPENVEELIALMARVPKSHRMQISGSCTLQNPGTRFYITGDKALLRAAADNSVDCRGTCWLIDYLANQSIITFSGAIAAYDRYKKPAESPFDECRALIAQWKQRQKME